MNSLDECYDRKENIFVKTLKIVLMRQTIDEDDRDDPVRVEMLTWAP